MTDAADTPPDFAPADHVPQCIVDCRAILGEGPVWVVAEQALYWVDIHGRRIFRRDEAGTVTEWATPFRVSSIAPHAHGGFIAGTDEGFARIDLARGRFEIVAHPEPERIGNRFNDGKVDRDGRFWAGTMHDLNEVSAGALYRIRFPLDPVRILDDHLVTNGPAFSADGQVMYHTDSAARTISRYDLSADGDAANGRTFAQFSEGEGHPDGMTVDAADCLWVAFWDGWCIRRLSPAGDVMAAFAMPVARPTSVAFGGAKLDRLFITSARVGLTDEALAAQPQAGGLFMMTPDVAGSNVIGLPEMPFSGGRSG